jgi:hypothetical protein
MSMVVPLARSPAGIMMSDEHLPVSCGVCNAPAVHSPLQHPGNPLMGYFVVFFLGCYSSFDMVVSSV